MNKYEQLIEHIINDDEAAAKQLFHSIVVEKSRDIYESLMYEEMTGADESAQMVSDITQQHQDSDDQGLGEEEDMPMDDGEEVFGADDEECEHCAGEGCEHCEGEHGEHDEHSEIVSKIDDLEAQLAELKDMLSGEESGMDDMDDMDDTDSNASDFDMDDDVEESSRINKGIDREVKRGGEEDMGKAPFQKESRTRKLSDVEVMKEYVNKMADIYNPNMTSEKGTVVGDGGGQHEGKGTSSDDSPTINTKDPVRKKDLGKFDGETTENIARGGAENAPDGKPIEKPRNLYSKGEKEQPLASKDGGYKNKIGGSKNPWNVPEPDHGRGFANIATKGKEDKEKGRLVGDNVTRPINDKAIIGKKVR
jgi:hypothetical protein